MRTLLTAALITAATIASAATPNAASLAKTVDAHYNHLQSLQARYAERYQGMGLDRTETGTLLLRKPGRMKWAYDTPAGKVFILDGHNAISWTPGDSQAQSLPEKELDDLRSPLRFLLGHTELAKELDGLTLTLIKFDDGSPGYTLSGTPRGMSQRIHTLALTVNASGQIQTMRVEEVGGAITTFTFTAMHENVPTTDPDFNFTPPAGVTIVKGAKPI